MPDPRRLKVGDRVRFVSLPVEWDDPDYTVHADSVEFMRALIARRRSCRVASVTDDGYPWIDARIREADGRLAHHSWGIYEASGWRLVRAQGS